MVRGLPQQRFSDISDPKGGEKRSSFEKLH